MNRAPRKHQHESVQPSRPLSQVLADPIFRTATSRIVEAVKDVRKTIRRWNPPSSSSAFTQAELVQGIRQLTNTDLPSPILLEICSLEDDLGAERQPVAEQSNEAWGSPTETAIGSDPYAPPTNPGEILSLAEMIELFKDRSSRILYRQLCASLPCSPNQLKKYLREVGLSTHGVRLTNRTFTVAELVDKLVPHLQHMRQQGCLAYRFLRICDNAGQVTRYR